MITDFEASTVTPISEMLGVLDSDLGQFSSDLTRFDSALQTVADTSAQALAQLSETTSLVYGAGIRVDEETGQVYSEADKQQEAELVDISSRLDAAEGTLTNTATMTMVNNAIAGAQLNPTDLAALGDLQLQVNTVETELNAINATLTSKAEVVFVDGLNVRLTTAEEQIDGLAGQITTKVEVADFNGAVDRLTSAEETLSALDIPTITHSVSEVRRIGDEVQVTADMNYAVQEETVERYAPEAAVRSEQTSEDTSAGASAAGVPGATTNKPQGLPGTTPVPSEGQLATAGAVRRQAVRNYELDKTTRYSRESVGRLQRVSAAVLVDHIPVRDAEGNVNLEPLPAEQVARLEALVREAIGFSEARGDSVSVMNAPFLNDVGELEAIEPLPIWQQPMVKDLLRQSGGVLLVIIILMALVRPMLKSLLASPAQMMGGQQLAMAGAGGQGVAMGAPGEEQVYLSDHAAVSQAGGAGGTGQPALTDQNQSFSIDLKAPYEDKVAAVRQVVTEDPKRVAQVVRQWVNDGE